MHNKTIFIYKNIFSKEIYMNFININNIKNVENIKNAIDKELDMQEFLSTYQFTDYIIYKNEDNNIETIPFKIIDNNVLTTNDKDIDILKKISLSGNNFIKLEENRDIYELLNNNVYILNKLENETYNKYVMNLNNKEDL